MCKGADLHSRDRCETRLRIAERTIPGRNARKVHRIRQGEPTMRAKVNGLGVSVVVLLLAIPSVAAGSGDRRLVDAVKKQDQAAARTLVNQGVDINTAAPAGATAPTWAGCGE